MNINELPLYKCHKVVRAAKIEWIDARPETVEVQGTPLLSLEYGISGQMCAISEDFIQKHNPQKGGYLVVYEDGYLSFSPADVFEAGYHELPPLGSSSGDTTAPEPKTAFLEAWRKAEALAFDYSHSLPEGEEREFALAIYHRVRLLFSNGKSVMAQGAGEVAVLGEEVNGEAPIFFLPVDPATDAAPATNMVAANGGPLAEIDLNAADFSDALMWLKEGKRVQRAGWNGAGQWVELCNPDDTAFYSNLDGPNVVYPITSHFGLKNAQGSFVPGWTPSTGDLMADDWQVVS